MGVCVRAYVHVCVLEVWWDVVVVLGVRRGLLVLAAHIAVLVLVLLELVWWWGRWCSCGCCYGGLMCGCHGDGDGLTGWQAN